MLKGIFEYNFICRNKKNKSQFFQNSITSNNDGLYNIVKQKLLKIKPKNATQKRTI